MGYSNEIKDLARKISAWRKFRGLSMADVGKRVGVVRSVVWKWESGDVSPPLSTLDLICKALDVPASVFFAVSPEKIPTRAKMRKVAAA